MRTVHLANYDNSWYRPGKSRLIQAIWFLGGLPILRCSLLPSSSLRVHLLRAFGAKIGSGVVIRPGVRVKYPWHLAIGNDSWIGEDCWIDNLAPVSIGSDACLSQASYLCTGNHDRSDVSFGLIVKSIHIENGAWVGARATIAPGVRLGTGAIAGLGSVVTRNIPSQEIHAGNPATFVAHREYRDRNHPSPLREELKIRPIAISRNQ